MVFHNTRHVVVLLIVASTFLLGCEDGPPQRTSQTDTEAVSNEAVSDVSQGVETLLMHAVELYQYGQLDSAIEKLKPLIGEKDPKAMYIAGVCSHAKGSIADKEVARQWFSKSRPGLEKLAVEKDSLAMYYLGVVLDRSSLTADKDRARSLWQKAFGPMETRAQQIDNSALQCRIGSMYYFGVGKQRDTTLGFQWLERAAAKGNPTAKLIMAKALASGAGVEKDQARSNALAQSAAEAGLPDALQFMGEAHYFGLGADQDYAKALEYFERAAAKNIVTAHRFLASSHLQGRGTPVNAEKAFDWYSKATDLGDVSSQASLAACYLNGQGVKADFDRARKLSLKAAEKGNDLAMRCLREIYAKGLGVKQDNVAAFKWCLKSAEAGSAESQVRIAAIYRYGIGVQSDRDKAIRWYEAAAKQGDATGKFNLAVMLSESKDAANYDPKRAESLFLEAASEGGSVDAMRHLGYWYARGVDTTVDQEKSRSWFGKAAELGDGTSQYAYGVKLEMGEGGPTDLPGAISYYTKAAEQKWQLAQLRLGILHQIGRGFPKDEATAVVWFQKAADGEYGNPTAQRHIGLAYLHGRGVARDEAEAIEWFEKAAKADDTDSQDQLYIIYSNKESPHYDPPVAEAWLAKVEKARGTEAKEKLIAFATRTAKAKARKAKLVEEVADFRAQVKFLEEQKAAARWVNKSNFNQPQVITGLLACDLSSASIDPTLLFTYTESLLERFENVSLPSNAGKEWKTRLVAARKRGLRRAAKRFRLRHPELTVDEGQRFVSSLGDGLLALATACKQRSGTLREVLDTAEAIATGTIPFDEMVLDGKHDADSVVNLLDVDPAVANLILNGIDTYLNERENVAGDSARRSLFRSECLQKVIDDVQSLVSGGNSGAVTAVMPKIVDAMKRFEAENESIERLENALSQGRLNDRIFALGLIAMSFDDAERIARWKTMVKQAKVASKSNSDADDMALAAICFAKPDSAVLKSASLQGKFKRLDLLRVALATAFATTGETEKSMAMLSNPASTYPKFQTATMVLDLKVKLVRHLMNNGQSEAVRKWVAGLLRKPRDMERQFDRPVLFAAVAAGSREDRDWSVAYREAAAMGEDQQYAFRLQGIVAAKAGALKAAEYCLRESVADGQSVDNEIALRSCLETMKGTDADLAKIRTLVNRIPAKAKYSRTAAQIDLAVASFMSNQPTSNWSIDAANVNTMTPLNRLYYRLRILSASKNEAF